MLGADDLTDKERVFCHEYLVDLNQSAAYLRAGYKAGRTPNQTSARASELRAKPSIDAHIAGLMARRVERTDITADRVVQELAKIAFASLRGFISIDAEGQPRIDLRRAGPDDLDALSEVQTEMVLERAGSGDEATTNTVRKTKVKMHNKLKALHDLAEHTGVFRTSDKNEPNPLSILLKQVLDRAESMPITALLSKGYSQRVR